MPTSELQLKGGTVVLVDEADVPLVEPFRWGLNGNGYVIASVPGHAKKMVSMHRLIAAPPSDMEVDHINGVKTDNTRNNLRICTRSENQRHVRPCGTTSRYKGVHRKQADQKWYATIYDNRKPIHLGTFATEIEAAAAYDIAARRLFGEFAYVNLASAGRPV